MADFLIAYRYLEPDEGAYSNNPKDSGGETYKGIARNKWPDWDGWITLDQLKSAGVNFPRVLDINPDLQDSVQRFYKKQFWRLDGLSNQDLANKIFDEEVNLGTGGLVRLLQQALRYVSGKQITIDGQYGPETEKLINLSDPGKLLTELRAQIAMYYCKLNNPTFLLGWMRRAVR